MPYSSSRRSASKALIVSRALEELISIIRAYRQEGYNGYVRVDHVPLMAGEDTNRPGYGNVGRLFAIGYLKGLLEMSGTLEA